MRLHSIRLVNYRGIAEATVEFGSGVTIVEGPNEIGKSSIHQAITQLREDKASSRKASVKDTQPVGSDVGPEVELHLTTGEYEVRYSKRWLKQSFTELNILRPVPEQLSGDEAHERFLAILDDTVDVDLLDALDVAQGRSLAPSLIGRDQSPARCTERIGRRTGRPRRLPQPGRGRIRQTLHRQGQRDRRIEEARRGIPGSRGAV